MGGRAGPGQGQQRARGPHGAVRAWLAPKGTESQRVLGHAQALGQESLLVRGAGTAPALELVETDRSASKSSLILIPAMLPWPDDFTFRASISSTAKWGYKHIPGRSQGG